MEWVYVALIIGTMVYSGGIVIDYTNRALEIRPRIARLFDLALQLTDQAEAELREKEAVVARGAELRTEIAHLQKEAELARNRMQTEEMRHTRLEMALLKTRFRGSQRLSSG